MAGSALSSALLARLPRPRAVVFRAFAGGFRPEPERSVAEWADAA